MLFVLQGMTVVVVSLGLLAACCRLISFVFAIVSGDGSRKVTVHREEDDQPEEIVAVIAAAVAATIDAPHRIVHARIQGQSDLAWSLEGRMQHHTSHTTKTLHPTGR
ncbi:MAG: hypothetical protein KDA44_22930 [Planctomycetales bacterium]|nr:hypothetical protein [Planctomycetales bacterium]